MKLDHLPVAVIGAGPIGLAAAANLIERGIPVRVFESGDTAGANIRDWGHIRLFSTWEQNVDPVSRRLLEASGWKMPAPTALPTGGDIYREYLEPLSKLERIAPVLETGSKVAKISRFGLDKVSGSNRAAQPFELWIETKTGEFKTELARAVIDSSGTWHNPNPLGASGIETPGERKFRERIFYGMPDILGADRIRYFGKRVAVIGAGFSAMNVLMDLAKLAETGSIKNITWIVRNSRMARVYGGGLADELPARGSLGIRIKALVDRGRIGLVRGFHSVDVKNGGDALSLLGLSDIGPVSIDGIDEIVVCTGQRPDLDMTRELRLEIDPWLESVKALGPLIDPNLHSCGTVPPHGHRELSHPEPGFYTIGVKSYGRAPTFLLLTGYEQARSVAAAIAGDMEAADNVELQLPETGICEDSMDEGAGCCGGPAKNIDEATGCCGGPAKNDVAACCVADEIAKVAGRSGCGCGPQA